MKQILLKSLTIVFFCSLALNPAISQNTDSKAKVTSIEDWETGDFSQYEWQFDGGADWLITDANPYEGLFCAQSGDINDNQTSGLYLDFEVYAEDTLSFWFKISSESNYDYLRFYVDGNELDNWSGEVPWQETSYVISAGSHTFKWEYTKDGSVSSPSDACWIDYITFPPMEIQALFTTDTTVICENDLVFYIDQSVGPVTEWDWYFEGGEPSTSTEQNPMVVYYNEGSWDVFLEVTDGIETGTTFEVEYMTVGAVPTAAPTPAGITFLCASWGNTSYTTTGMTGITEYDWVIEPTEAGTISGNGTNITVIWEEEFLGEADLMVSAINYCGVGAYSEPLTITRYLPDVSLMLPAFVAITEPAFELTGGIPVGGEYTGPGVSGGMFDPAVAGLGTHTITYTITDINLCTNSAIDSITVTEFTGIINQSDQSAVNIYPNPNNGNFKIKFNLQQNDIVSLKVYNALNAVVFEENSISVGQTFAKDLELNDLTKGVYYLHIDGKKTNIIKKLVIQ